jgi:hypothetical protein
MPIAWCQCCYIMKIVIYKARQSQSLLGLYYMRLRIEKYNYYLVNHLHEMIHDIIKQSGGSFGVLHLVLSRAIYI